MADESWRPFGGGANTPEPGAGKPKPNNNSPSIPVVNSPANGGKTNDKVEIPRWKGTSKGI